MKTCWRQIIKPPIKPPRPLNLNFSPHRTSFYLPSSQRFIHPRIFHQNTRPPFDVKKSGFASNSIAAVILYTSVAGLIIWLSYPQKPSINTVPDQGSYRPSSRVPHVIVAPGMLSEIPPGRPGNLTADQQAKLKEFWEACLHIFGVFPVSGSADAKAVGGTHSADRPSTPESSSKKKRRFGGFLHRKDKDSESDSEPSADTDDKYGQTKEFKAALASMSPEDLRAAFWNMTKADHPDGLMLRYLRARKWNVQNALVMLVSTMRWRSQDIHIDDDIMKTGEGVALEDSKSDDPHVKKEGDDFLAQIRMGKSYLHGCDVDGRPVCVVNVRMHRQGEQSESSLEKYTVYTIETGRLLLRPPIDTAVILFDMTSFSMANMDYSPVKFMIKCFEANYPESLGAVLVHKSPWIFHSIWTIIKGWLDPVVASKVHFTKDTAELSEFIPMSQIPHELGGEELWRHKYLEPEPNENAKMKDTVARDKILEERKGFWQEYEKLTVDWCQGRTGDEIMSKRTDLAEKLRANYWRLDPYVRARSLYDRCGMIKPDGTIKFYPEKQETSSDDVD